MTANAKELAALLLCVIAAGCGAPQARINVAKGEEVTAEFGRLQDLLSPPEAAGSDEAFYTLVAIIADESGGDDALFHTKMLSSFNGKSVQDVLDEYHKLDPAVVAKHAKAIEERKAKDRAEEEERFNKRFNEELQAMIQEQIDTLDNLQRKK